MHASSLTRTTSSILRVIFRVRARVRASICSSLRDFIFSSRVRLLCVSPQLNTLEELAGCKLSVLYIFLTNSEVERSTHGLISDDYSSSCLPANLQLKPNAVFSSRSRHALKTLTLPPPTINFFRKEPETSPLDCIYLLRR